MSLSANAQLRLREDNIDAVVKAMTLREKATLVMGGGWGSMFEGFGIAGTKGHRVPGAAGETRAIERLGIPSIILSDGPAGVRIALSGATAFPVGLSLASVQDTALVEEVGRAIGDEAAAFGVDVMLGPGMNIIRNPLCGRSFEYFSEDPAVSSRTARAVVRGIQSAGVGACVKHFAVNNQETNRMKNDARVGEQTLRELYLKNFHDAICTGDELSTPWTVMSAYNALNGTLVQENEWLLTDVLRGEWGYEGVVMTDWRGHKHVARRVGAGNDLLMPGWKAKIHRIVWGVRTGKLDEKKLDEACRRMLRLIVKTYTFRGGRPASIDRVAHLDLSRKVGAAGSVLLKGNDGAMLTIGADDRIALLGANSRSLVAGGTGSGSVNCGHLVSFSEGLEAAGYQLEQTTQDYYTLYARDKKNFLHPKKMSAISPEMGTPTLREPGLSTMQLKAAAAASDVAVIVIARQAGEGGDRTLTEGDWYLTPEEMQLIDDACRIFHEQQKQVVVVLNVAGVVEMASWIDRPDCVLQVWGPGQEGGHAVADILSGKALPLGRLPISIPRRYEDMPSSEHFPLAPKGPNVDYTEYTEGTRLAPADPLFPIGFSALE